jgi:AAA15 family ATPase/GTPase
MLIAFSVENFKSIRDLQTLSMEARAGDHLEASHTFEAGKRRLVKSVAIYGPNASGKSNVIEALFWFRQFVIYSSREGQAGDLIRIPPFRLSAATENAPTHFEVEFVVNGFEYRYGFQVLTKEVVSEWLFRKAPSVKASLLFNRDRGKIDVSSKHFREGKGLEERTRPNALFLSVCAQFNGEISTEVLRWMQRLRHVDGISERGFFDFTASQIRSDYGRSLLELAQKADFNIRSLRSEIETFTEAMLPDSMPADQRRQIVAANHVFRSTILTTHDKRDADDLVTGQVEFDLETDESNGTQKFIALSGPLTHTLREGAILIVDELEARLHPRLTQAIVDLFHGATNPHGAQLICATHDVTLMEPERFRRDQIWFCEKDHTGATDLYCLAEFDPNQVRPTSKFSRQYLLGLFGAVPKLAHFEEAALHGIKQD